MSPIVSCCCLAVSALFLNACNHVSMQVSAPADLPASLDGGPRKVSSRVTPVHARKGAGKIRYSILEITVPDRGAAGDSVLDQLRALPGKGTTAPLVFPSFQSLAATKGVDVMSAGTAREGQTLRAAITRPVKYPVEFAEDGRPLSMTDSDVGVTASLHGEAGKAGITIKGSVEVREFLGFVKYPLPSGAEVLQPKFSRRAESFDSLRIPAGGFAVFPGTRREDAMQVEDVRLGGLVRKRSTEINYRFIGVAAVTE